MCIGSALVDIKVFCNEGIKQGAYQKGSIEIVPGGVAYCMAVNMARLGFFTSLVTVVGNDVFGEYLKADLINKKVDISLFGVNSDSKTAVFSALMNSDAVSYCVYDTNIFQYINIDTKTVEYINKNSINALVLDSNISESALDRLYSAKQEHDLFVFQNATSPELALKSRPYISLIDLFACNEYEARVIIGQKANPDHTTAEKFIKMGYKAFIITFGSEGVLVCIRNRIWIEKPFKPERIIDTIGAGDAFASGFLFGYLNGEIIDNCIKYGLVCAKETLATVADTNEVIDIKLLKQCGGMKLL
jgi:sugar/nucleoside kinase (ribokinase family)